jgi:transcriptional regulator with XRE-family HTH domain
MNSRHVYRQIGALIREQRKKKKYIQEDLAKQIGVSRAAIANIEAGRQQLLVHQLCAIAKALEVEFATLMPNPDSAPAFELSAQVRLPADLTHAQREQILKLIQTASTATEEEINAPATNKESAGPS